MGSRPSSQLRTVTSDVPDENALIQIFPSSHVCSPTCTWGQARKGNSEGGLTPNCIKFHNVAAADLFRDCVWCLAEMQRFTAAELTVRVCLFCEREPRARPAKAGHLSFKPVAGAPHSFYGFLAKLVAKVANVHVDDI